MNHAMNPLAGEIQKAEQRLAAAQAQAQAMQHYQYPPAQQALSTYPMQQQRPFDSTDALLGEVLREVLELRRDMAAVLAVMAELRDMRKQSGGFPSNALKHSR